LCSRRLTDGFFSEFSEASNKALFHGKGHDTSLPISHALANRLPELGVRCGSSSSVSRSRGASKPACSLQPTIRLIVVRPSSPVVSRQKGNFAEYPWRDDMSRLFLEFRGGSTTMRSRAPGGSSARSISWWSRPARTTIPEHLLDILPARERGRRGLARTRLQHVATAAAIDLGRLGDWFRSIPRAATRTSRFAALAA
jgi:hypothetical protein